MKFDFNQSLNKPKKEEKLVKNSAPLFNKELGQHILKNPLIVQNIIKKADLNKSDVCLEIGCGTGNLTVKIMENCSKVIGYEMDTRLANELIKRTKTAGQTHKLDLKLGDAIKMDFPRFDVCISNTPYQISSPLIFKLISHRPLMRCAILMFQKEFAQRLLAKPGEKLYSRLSVNVQLYFQIKLVMNISKNSFRPPPKVDSAVVKMEPIRPQPQIVFEEFDGLNRILFMRKNKLIRSLLCEKHILKMLNKNRLIILNKNNTNLDMAEDLEETKQIIHGVLKNLNMEDSRASKMNQNDFLRLLNGFHEVNIHFA